MEIIIRRRDIYVSVTAITLFVCWCAYAQYENHVIQAALKERASGHVDEWFATEEPGTRREDHEYVAIVDTERPYRIFGPCYGVVHVYIREKGDVDCKTFKGIEYFYKHDEGSWVLQDSAGCGAKEHHIRAFETYLANGRGVEEHVFDQALGIDFDVEKVRARLEGGARHKHEHGEDHDHEHHHGHDETPSEVSAPVPVVTGDDNPDSLSSNHPRNRAASRIAAPDHTIHGADEIHDHE